MKECKRDWWILECVQEKGCGGNLGEEDTLRCRGLYPVGVYKHVFNAYNMCVSIRFPLCVCIYHLYKFLFLSRIYMWSIRWSSFECFALRIKRHHHMNRQVHFFPSCPCPCQSITVVEEKVVCRFSSIISLSLCLFSFLFFFVFLFSSLSSSLCNSKRTTTLTCNPNLGRCTGPRCPDGWRCAKKGNSTKKKGNNNKLVNLN